MRQTHPASCLLEIEERCRRPARRRDGWCARVPDRPQLHLSRQVRWPHRGPITRAFLEVLEALLWGFHNSRDGRCFPSYEAIATKAECARSTVAEALKVLEWAGVLTWVHRIARIQVRERDLFGRWATRWRVIRTSNAYVFRDPGPRVAGVPASKSEIRSGTQNQEILMALSAPAPDPDSPWSAPCSTWAA
jgi:hypothetical protein